MPQPIADLLDAVFRFTFLVVLVTAVACVVVRWVLPPLLELVRRCLLDAIDFLAACAVLPEYWLSTTNDDDAPPLLAYEYGYAVAAIAHAVHTAVGWVLRAAARVAGAAHPLVVAVVAGAVEIFRLI